MAGLVLMAAVVSCKKPDDGGKQKEDPVEVPQNPTERIDEATGNAIVEWSANPAATGYEVELEGTDLGGGVHTNSYTFEKRDLEYDTDYRWRVRTHVGSKASDWIEWRTFSTPKKPVSSLWPGTWRASQDDVDMTATVMMAGMNVELTDWLTGGLGDFALPAGDLDLVLTPDEEDEKKMLLSIASLGAILPDAIQNAALTVTADNRLSGNYGGMEKQTYSLITETTPNGIPLSSIPGFSQIVESLPVGGDIIMNLNVTAISLTVNSTSISGRMTDATGTKANIKLSVDSTIGIETDVTGMAAILVNGLLGSMPLLASLDIDCTKVE